MLFYIREKGLEINKDSVLHAYEVDIVADGPLRKTLTNGDLVSIDDSLYVVDDYVYSNIHKKGVYIVKPYVLISYKAKRVIEEDIKL